MTYAQDQDAIIAELKEQLAKANAEVEQLKSLHGWVSVDERLPNDGDQVLIYIGSQISVAEKCKVFGFIDAIERDAYRCDMITHWMPLPTPPEK